MAQANIPPRFWNTGLDQVSISPEVEKAIKDYVHNFDREAESSRGLLIVGPEQTGKTSLLTIILKSLMTRDYKCHYARADDIVSLHYKRDQDAYEYTYDDLLSSKVLGVDDIAANGNSGYPIALGNVLRARFNSQNPTLVCVTTREDSLGEREIEADYGRELAQWFRNHYTILPLAFDGSFESKVRA